jgi:hypothetical protein
LVSRATFGEGLEAAPGARSVRTNALSSARLRDAPADASLGSLPETLSQPLSRLGRIQPRTDAPAY